MSQFLFFPPGSNNFPKSRVPSVRAKSLGGGALALLVLVKAQLRLGGSRTRAAVVVKPIANFLEKDINNQ